VADQALDHAEEVRQLFDAKAGNWAARYSPDGRLVGRLMQLAAAIGYHVPPRGRVLDLGCGTGKLARHLAGAGLRVTGCDISANMLDRAAAADPAATAGWIQLDPDWRTLPFATASFDAVLAASVLEYVGSPDAVLGECARVLRSGGVLLCTVPDPRHPVRWLEWLLATAAQVPPVRTAAEEWPRLGRYLTYLRISCHRRSAAWWRAAAARAGLLAVPGPGRTAENSPLRLFTFQRLDGPRGAS
jgi:SAM-dependent methyltransferase